MADVDVSGWWFGLLWQWCELLAVRRAPPQGSGCPSSSQICRYRLKEQKGHSCSAGGYNLLSALPVAGTCAAHCCHRCVKQITSAHSILHSLSSNQCSILFCWSEVHPWLCDRLSESQSDRCLFAKWINSLSATLGGKDTVNQTTYHHSLLYNE